MDAVGHARSVGGPAALRPLIVSKFDYVAKRIMKFHYEERYS